MKVQFRGKRQHSKHQMHISTWQTPNWFEKWLLFKRPCIVNYVGKGTKWYEMRIGPRYKGFVKYISVKNKTLLEWLRKQHP